MGAIRNKERVILVAGLLLKNDEALRQLLEKELEKLWGPMSHGSEEVDFSFSDYYEKEMGVKLKRRFVAFQEPFYAGNLLQAKLNSNEIEERLAISRKRRVNVDPGYLDLSKVVVASTKDATYRVYLGEGIYAQSMLRYEGGSYHPWKWTYPDYRSEMAIAFFNRVRSDYKRRGKGVTGA